MEIMITKTGKKTDGTFWHLCSATDAAGFVKSGLFTNTKEMKVGKATIPVEVYKGMVWSY
jgi:hypothetical protein